MLQDGDANVDDQDTVPAAADDDEDNGHINIFTIGSVHSLLAKTFKTSQIMRYV